MFILHSDVKNIAKLLLNGALRVSCLNILTLFCYNCQNRNVILKCSVVLETGVAFSLFCRPGNIWICSQFLCYDKLEVIGTSEKFKKLKCKTCIMTVGL